MDEFQPKRAYTALMTLLDSDTPKKRRLATSQASINLLNQRDPGNVEGVEVGAEDDNNDEEISESDVEIVVDEDAHIKDDDPFEVHFCCTEVDKPAQSEWPATAVNCGIAGSRSLLRVPPASHAILPKYPQSISSLPIKHRLLAPWSRCNPEFTELQRQLSGPLMAYQTILWAERTLKNASEVTRLVLLHALNHIYKTRDRVLRNNERCKENEDIEVRDQGFTRPKVLILEPTRASALKIIEELFQLSGVRQMESRKRLMDAFGGEGADLSTKPEDFQDLFGGNTDDMFCLGLKFTRQALKPYSSFYQSDIIIGSPLGLRMLVNKGETDFLSSIEILLVDRADALQMQAWENVVQVLDATNQMPRDSHGCDFSRVRPWYLDNHAQYLRQTIILSSYVSPEILSAFNRSTNIAGRLRLRPGPIPGALQNIGIRVRQTFVRLGPYPISADADRKLEHLTGTTIPALIRRDEPGILVVAPTYPSFVRIRNYLEHNDFSYVSASEYTPSAQLSRGRSYFADGRAKIFLYSARLHHYRRFHLKGVRQVVFAGLPDNPQFYTEIVRNLARTVIESGVDPDALRVWIAYSKWDALRLERIVGTSRMPQLLEGQAKVVDIF